VRKGAARTDRHTIPRWVRTQSDVFQCGENVMSRPNLVMRGYGFCMVFFMVSVSIASPDFPSRLSERFINYMRAWEGFVG
jgi:hypothetical protein